MRAWSIMAVAVVVGGCAPRAVDRAARDASILAAEHAPRTLLARGLAFARVGDLARAEQYLSAAIDAGAPRREALPPLLAVCIADAHYRAAIEYAAPALRDHPGDARLRFVVAELERATGDVADAARDLEAVTRVQPASAAPHFAYARLLRDDVGDRVAADREFRAYLALDASGEHAEEARASLLKSVAQPAPSVEEPIHR